MAPTLEHLYGENVHVLADPVLSTLLVRIGGPQTGTAEVPGLVRRAYTRLVHEVLNREFPRGEFRLPTRMTAQEPRAFVQGELLCRDTRLVICAVIRAGILPAQACYEAAIDVLPPEHVRLDFLNMSRQTDEQHHVTGVRLDGSRIGGPVDDAIVLIPDPMGATGGTVCRAVDVYRELGGRGPRAIVAAHLMVTPVFRARPREQARYVPGRRTGPQRRAVHRSGRGRHGRVADEQLGLTGSDPAVGLVRDGSARRMVFVMAHPAVGPAQRPRGATDRATAAPQPIRKRAH
jgi:uracil phosphoribosyltransferase